MSVEEDARRISAKIATVYAGGQINMANPNEPPTDALPPIPNPDIPNLDVPPRAQVQELLNEEIHYSVKRRRDTYEAGPITNFTDASTFARILSELTVDIWNVLETRRTVTSVATFSPPTS